MLLPFDRPRRAPVPRLSVLSPHRWSEHVGTRLGRTFPYGGLRFCPRSIQLLAYQLEPALAVFRHATSRVLIGDDVGLGKTVEAGVIVKEVVGRKATARVLVIMPASLRAQWKQELASLFELPSIDADATWLRTITRELPPDVNPWSIPGIYLSSIDFVKRPEVLAPLESVRWDLLVVDEAHGATPRTDRLAAVDALGCRASTVVLLSGTPHSGDQDQFDALCGIGSGAGHSPLVCFRRTRADVHVAQGPVRSRVLTVPPTDDERRMHRQLERYTALLWASARRGEANPALLATVFRKRALSSAGALAVSLLRRLASMASLPRVETQPWLPLDHDESEDAVGDEDADTVIGGKGLDDPVTERAAIEQCLRAAEASSASESKTALLLRLLSRLHSPAIVFSEYRDTAVRLRERIAALGHRVVLLHGGLTPSERGVATTEFLRGGAVMVATDAASEGLNLHHSCRLVIHYELPWSPARLHQRCGRVNRIGQRRRVHEIALVAADTAEQLVLQPLLRRARLSGPFTRGSIVHQLPEAVVMARVFGGEPVTEPAGPATSARDTEPFITLDLGAEGRAEVERLETMRRVVEGARGGSAGLVIPVTLRPSAAREREVRRTNGSMTIVYSVGFRNGAGELLEETLLPVAVEYGGRRWRHRRSALRAQVRAALADVAPLLDSALETVAGARVAAIATAHGHDVSAREARRRAMSGPLPSTAGVLVQPGLFGRAGLRTEQKPPASALLEEAPIEEDAAAADRLAGSRGSRDLREPGVIAGMSGSLLSHDALDELWQRPDPAVVTFAAGKPYRHLRAWHAGIRARLGPTATARTIFDAVAEPLLRSLGFDISVVQSSSQSVAALLTTSARPVAALIAAPWVVPLRTLWRQAVRCGLAHQVRWTICVNGSAIAAFDVRRAYARRWVEFEMEVALDVERSLGVLCTLLGARALAGSGDRAVIERVLDHSERHRAAVRGSLRSGVHDAVLQLVSAFREAVSRTHTDSHLLDESLIVVYRLLFLLFAEARNLVPTWHPIYRDSYTIDTIVRPLHNDRSPTGVWEAFQALSRLAHRGCRAGPMRVPPFNGRLFSPACAPLAARVSLSDSVVRRAVLSLTSRASAEGRRSISYADLGVEQLGAVYEHLLDFVVSTQDPSGARMIATGRRKATGSFYTPRALTEFVVRRGLAAVVQGRTPDGILALRVVDPAMGSGAFLVSACRYLAQAYEQALIEEGTVTAADLTEQDRAGFRRAVAQRCLFGVDINPMAVQLARLSMWLATLAADKPLTFLDHRLRVGHSLIGASVADVVCRPFPGRARRPRDLPLFPTDDFAASMESAIGVRRQIAEGPDDSLDQVRGKERTLAALESEDGPLARWREAADLWCAAWLDEGIARDRRTFGALLDHVLRRGSALPPRTLEPLLAHARGVSRSARVFNWAMEFPEVFYGDDGVEKDTSGFDVVLGNPPWDVLHETEGRDSERRLTTYARGSGQYGLQGSGHANLYQLFFERGLRLLKPGGRCALILPSGFATDQGSGRLRRHLLERTEVDTFATIDNRDGIFPIHRSLKFVLLTFNNGGTDGDGAVAVRGAVGRVARLRPGQRRRPRGAAGAEIDCRAREWRGAGAARHPDGTGPGDSHEDHRPGPGERQPSRMAHPLRPGAERDRRPAALHEPRRSANS